MINIFIKFLIIFVFLIVIESKFLRQTHTADCAHGYCYFSNMNLSRVTYFDVRSNIPASEVIFLSLGGGQDGSKIHTLTHQFCDMFPNVEEISASNLGIAQIQPNAFVGCKKLERLDLSGNNLKRLELGQFMDYSKLKELSVSNNLFRDIDEIQLIQKFKGLKSVRLCPNDKMKGDRLIQIAHYLKKNYVKFYELDYC